MNKIKKLFQIPQTHYTTREIFRWLWLAWRGNRKQAVLNAVTPLMGLPMSWREVSMRR